jgi:hypothetical protein
LLKLALREVWNRGRPVLRGKFVHERLLRVPLRKQQLWQPVLRGCGHGLRYLLLFDCRQLYLCGERIVPGQRKRQPLRWHRPALLYFDRFPYLDFVQLLLSAGQPLQLQQRHA